MCLISSPELRRQTGRDSHAGRTGRQVVDFVDGGACANCCPEWFAPDYPVLPLNESAPSLRSLSGKTLDLQGQKIVPLDCGTGHSLSVQFSVCTGIPFPLVSVSRLLLQDFWTVMAKDYLAIDPTGNPVPIVRQGTLVYLTPTVIPYAVANAARMAASCLPEVMTGIEHELGSVELRGVSDMHDGSIDHLFRRVRVWRHEMLDPRIKLAKKSPVPITGSWPRLTGERVTYKKYKDGSTVTVRGENVLALKNTRPNDPKEWRGRVEFGLKHKPQLRHVQKSAPHPYDPMIGRDKSEVVNEEIVQFHKSNDPVGRMQKADVEPAVLDHQMTVSRNVEEHELENTLLSLPQHGSSMKELLLQVFNLQDL